MKCSYCTIEQLDCNCCRACKHPHMVGSDCTNSKCHCGRSLHNLPKDTKTTNNSKRLDSHFMRYEKEWTRLKRAKNVDN